MLERDYLLRERNDSTVEALETYLRDMAIELGADPTVAQQDAAAVVDLQRELANVSSHRVSKFTKLQRVKERDVAVT